MRDWVKELPSDGHWWHTQDGEVFEELATELEALGVSAKKTEEILTQAYGAVANEFGM